MANSCGSIGFYIFNGHCIYNGKRVPDPPRFNKNSVNLTTTNNKVYLNGYEFFPEHIKWRRTFKAVWHYLCNLF
jgi:hypothetical protein